jgi:hypothetical protein
MQHSDGRVFDTHVTKSHTSENCPYKEKAEKWDGLDKEWIDGKTWGQLLEENKRLKEKLGVTLADLHIANDYIISLEHDLNESNPTTTEEGTS